MLVIDLGIQIFAQKLAVDEFYICTIINQWLFQLRFKVNHVTDVFTNAI